MNNSSSKIAYSLLGVLAVFAVVTLVPEIAWAQVDLGLAKFTAVKDSLDEVAIILLVIAGILTGIYIGFGRQGGNEKLFNVVKGAIIISVVGAGGVAWLAS